MPFSDAFQSYNHYQNSSFKQSPAQRDASSRNDEIYAAARRQREARRASALDPKDSDSPDARQTVTRESEQGGESLEWKHDLGAATTESAAAAEEGGRGREGSGEGQGKPLPDFEMDERGNVYLKSSGGGGTGWWKKAKGALRRKSAEPDVVR